MCGAARSTSIPYQVLLGVPTDPRPHRRNAPNRRHTVSTGRGFQPCVHACAAACLTWKGIHQQDRQDCPIETPLRMHLVSTAFFCWRPREPLRRLRPVSRICQGGGGFFAASHFSLCCSANTQPSRHFPFQIIGRRTGFLSGLCCSTAMWWSSIRRFCCGRSLGVTKQPLTARLIVVAHTHTHT